MRIELIFIKKRALFALFFSIVFLTSMIPVFIVDNESTVFENNDLIDNQIETPLYEFTMTPDQNLKHESQVELNAIVKDGTVSAGEYDVYVSIEDNAQNGDTLDFYYTLDDAGGKIHMAMSALAGGYVSVGWGAESINSMNLADYIIGWVTDGGSTVTISDNIGTGTTSHIVDTNQDIDAGYAGTDDNTRTTIELSRDLSTGDGQDVAISRGSSTILQMAWHGTKDDLTSKHSARGAMNHIWGGEGDIACSRSEDGTIENGEYAHSEILTQNANTLEFYYTIDSGAGKIYAGITSAVTGYIAIGWGADAITSMNSADITIGFVSSGTAYVQDEIGISSTSHANDTDQSGTYDIDSYAGTESGGSTTIEFTRSLDTGDTSGDVVISGGSGTNL
ncbi:MAG: DOMON domain-containing protein, partial [Candidatus Kariarchaeaceae archaeon]